MSHCHLLRKEMLDAEYTRIIAQAQDYRAVFGKEDFS
mgnify:CR=1 FL=1